VVLDQIAVLSCDCVASHAGNRACRNPFDCDRVATEEDSQSCPYERRCLLDELAAKGVRLTAQRRVLVEIIQKAEQHLDAASLLELARRREPNIDRATVYRTLELLKKHRLIDELDLMHLHGEKHYYEVKTKRDHIHLACFSCGRIEEFASSMFEHLKAEVSKQAHFSIRVTRLEVGGLCRACEAAANKSTTPELLEMQQH
jgi:Fur family ferric uptake transcriptional regulator